MPLAGAGKRNCCCAPQALRQGGHHREHLKGPFVGFATAAVSALAPPPPFRAYPGLCRSPAFQPTDARMAKFVTSNQAKGISAAAVIALLLSGKWHTADRMVMLLSFGLHEKHAAALLPKAV